MEAVNYSIDGFLYKIKEEEEEIREESGLSVC